MAETLRSDYKTIAMPGNGKKILELGGFDPRDGEFVTRGEIQKPEQEWTIDDVLKQYDPEELPQI